MSERDEMTRVIWEEIPACAEYASTLIADALLAAGFGKVDDLRAVLDEMFLRATAWDDCADEAFERGHLHDVALAEMKARNPYRVVVRHG